MVALRLPARLDNLERFRSFVLEQAALLTPEAEGLEPKLDLVLEELLVNVMRYAYPDSEGEVEVACSLDDRGCFVLRITDWGGSFDPVASAPAPDTSLGVEERGIGGLGVFFVRRMTERMEYIREGDANTVVLHVCA